MLQMLKINALNAMLQIFAYNNLMGIYMGNAYVIIVIMMMD